MNEDKILFAIPLYSQTEESYRIKWEKTFQREFSLYDRSDAEIEELRSFKLSRDPNFYRYNDIVGFAELVIDYKDIFIYYHMNGDLRHAFNKNIKRFRGTKKIYRDLNLSGTWDSSFTNIDNRSIRKAVVASLKSIDKQSKDWNIVANINPYLEKIQYFNFKKYLTHKYEF